MVQTIQLFSTEYVILSGVYACAGYMRENTAVVVVVGGVNVYVDSMKTSSW